MKAALYAFALAVAASVPVAAAEGELPLPRFVSIGSGEANLRAGPGERYPVSWVFVFKGEPVEIVDEFTDWRKIRDIDGQSGWVHKSLLSGRRAAIATEGLNAFRVDPDLNAPVAFYAERGVRGALKRCDREWCEFAVSGKSGWIEKTALWGVYADETFN